MRRVVLKDIRTWRMMPVAVWSLASLLGLAISANAFFGQTGSGRQFAVGDPAVEGNARIEVDAPETGGRTIQLKYDPVVEAVQRELSAAGYYKGMIDGVIGRKTRQAISNYQAAMGLEPDGKPSSDLADHIRYTREVAEASLFTGTIEPDAAAETRATVRRVQTGLAELAYSPGEINGELTRQTRNAILAFQQDRKLEATGEISDELMAELGKMSGQTELSRD
jgi:peptidoglycan hydrolase-like protein with peptidoglycan-binding domain